MAKSEKHEGWTNYETWLVQLWIDNDEPHYRERCEMAKRIPSLYPFSDAIKAWLEGIMEGHEGLTADLITAALARVNWDEIARAWHVEAREARERAKS